MKYGRHFRISPDAKLVVGRHQEDNAHLKAIKNDKFFTLFMPEGTIGPVSLLSKTATTEDKETAARIVLTYGKTDPKQTYSILIGDDCVTVTPYESKETVRDMLLL